MILKIRKPRDSEMIFFSALFLWVLQSYMIQTDFLKFYGYFPCTVVRLMSLSLFAFKILFLDKKYSRLIFFFSVICLTVSIMVQFTTVETTINTFLNVFIIIMSARNISFERIVRFIFIVSGLGFIITVSFAFVGVLNNSALIIENKKRYYLGFDYVSFASIYLVNIILSGFYIYTIKRKKSLPWIYIVFAVMVDIFIYLLTSTRLTFGIVLMFICLYIIVEKLHIPLFKEKRIWKIISIVLFPVMGIITCWISYLYNSTDVKWIILNKLLSNRLLLNKRALTVYGLKWFGQVIEFNTNFSSGIDNYMYIDSGYMNLLIQYGIVAFIVVLTIYSFVFWNAMKREDNVLVIWLLCICIYNVVNGMLLNPVTNSSLFAVWMFQQDLKRKEI